MSPVVVIRPLSGYVNRLQAVVSAQLLAEQLEADLWINWEPDAVAPAAMDQILPTPYVERSRSTAEVSEHFETDMASVPRNLSFDPEKGIVTLAGLDRGEQFFMPQLQDYLQHHEVRAILISAGGKFTLSDRPVLSESEGRDFRSKRCEVYQRLRLHRGIEDRVESELKNHPRFAALHLRYSDRSIDSPWNRQIIRALKGLREHNDADELFIASDTPVVRDQWHELSRDLGFEPWSAAAGDLPRADPRSAWDALVDWRLLSNSQEMVYFAASSFAEEACVASGHFDESAALSASSLRKSWVKGQEWSQAVRTYPQRHGWSL